MSREDDGDGQDVVTRYWGRRESDDYYVGFPNGNTIWAKDAEGKYTEYVYDTT